MVYLDLLLGQTEKGTDRWTDVLRGLRGPAGDLRSTDQHPPTWLRTLRCDSQLSPQPPLTQ